MNTENTNAKSLVTDVMQSVILPQELRIGNYIKCPPFKKESDFLKIDNEVLLNLINCNTWHIIKPIEINDEWLIKLGFEKSEEKYSDWLRMNYFSYSLDGLTTSDTYFYFQFHSGYILKHIKYVHQLQNLYLSLTGCELTVA